ncbi:MAG: GPW/gp25 family protein [Myxococcota bacterium]
MAARKDFLGRGWSFPFHFDPATGAVATSEFEENIRQSITIILGTRPGERQMLPDFGCRIHELLFAPNTPSTARQARRYVEEALVNWEPRIEVTDVRSEPDPSGAIRIQVSYRIPSTGATETLSHVVTNR